MRRNEQPELSIIIPSLGEQKRIESSLDELAEFLMTDKFFKTKKVEVLVVAADVGDKTQAIVKKKLAKFSNCRLLEPGLPVGKGRDVRLGMLEARGKTAIFMDADLATPLHHLEKFYRKCLSGSDIVIGTRDILNYRRSGLKNRLFYAGNFYIRTLSGLKFEDTQCGFKMFNEHARKLCFSKMTIVGWGFDIEILVIAKLKHLKVSSFRVDDWQDVPGGTHHESPLRIFWRVTIDFVRIFSNRLRRQY